MQNKARFVASYGHSKQRPHNETGDFCRYLDWDSDFFGYRIGRVILNQLNDETIGLVLQWCATNKIDCLYFLADTTDDTTVRLAEDNGFHLVDIRVTLEMQVESTRDVGWKRHQGIVRLFRSEDLPVLREIARSAYRLTRFHFDLNFPEALRETLYEIWTEKSCKGYADVVLVAEIRERVAGYITCHLLGGEIGEIGLVGVDASWQRIGLGHKLVSASLSWFVEQGVTHVQVVTQGRNHPGQRLYQKSGFLTKSVQLWYHRWFLNYGYSNE